ncbi:MAG: hypothetical protein PHH11_08155 [Methylomonas sp.]|nr:hypothetical protein [Methylomonas sp.]
MILILKKISEKTRVPDIENFIAPVLKGGFLKKTGRIESLRIQTIRQAGDSHVEYQAIVDVTPDPVAKRIIKLLNRKCLNGKHINIAEYHFRHFSNDRRHGRYKPPHDRRIADRRRKQVEIVDITAERKGARIDYSILNMLE